MKKIKLTVLLTLVCMLLLTTSVSFAALPNVKILATGGTIAGSATSSTQMTGYTAGAIGIQVLMDAVPQMQQYANVSGEQVASIASPSMTNEIWLGIAKRVNELLAQSDVDGIVITHGTDTLEETAYFLNLVVKSKKPVVLVGAMRPATAISADGPVNLLNAVRLAANRDARGRGVMVAMNDEINGARDVTKTNTTHVQTFKAPELGCLGYINNGVASFYKESSRLHTYKSEFSVKDLKELPYVPIIYGYVNMETLFIKSALDAGAKGIVFAGAGNGSLPKQIEQILYDAAKQGVVVVRSSRVGNGTVTEYLKAWTDNNILWSDTLNPQKARILLMMALTKTNDPAQVQKYFDTY